MSDLSEADRFLLEQIRQGDADGWRQLVERYQGRLVAFARSRLRQQADAEDLVQDTLMGFLKGLADFRGQASIETYLFTILRRKIINWFRGRRMTVCLLQDTLGGGDSETSDAGPAPADRMPAPDPTASWYVRRDEAHDIQRAALSAALRELINGLKESQNFRDLQVVEMLFYCQLRNKDAAAIASLDEKHVALIKHRCLKQIRHDVQHRLRAAASGFESSAGPAADFGPASDAIITEIWQEHRPSCLKRSTIGAYLLGTLDAPWRDYVTFHLERLACQFCRANLEDLQRQTADGASRSLRDRIMESTIGFLSTP